MKSDYKNWVPKGMIAGFGTASAAVGTGMMKKVRCRLPVRNGIRRHISSGLIRGAGICRFLQRTVRKERRGGRCEQCGIPLRKRRKAGLPDETFDAVTSNYVYHNIGSFQIVGGITSTLSGLALIFSDKKQESEK